MPGLIQRLSAAAAPVRRFWCALPFILTGVAGVGAVNAAEPREAGSAEAVAPALVVAWEQIAQLDYAGAEVSFAQLLEENPGSRHARLGSAIVRLNRPPKSNAATAAIAGELEEIRAGDPNDEIGLLAGFQLARLYHVHFYPADLDEARRRYAALHAAHPRHYLGQNALLRLATIDLFSIWPQPDPEALITKWEARRAEFIDPVVRRNFLRKLGDAILWFDLPPKRALPFFVEANEVGFARFDIRTLMMMKVYTISVEEGLPDLTRVVAQRYLQEFPRDLWSQFMRERLAELDGRPQP